MYTVKLIGQTWYVDYTDLEQQCISLESESIKLV